MAVQGYEKPFIDNPIHADKGVEKSMPKLSYLKIAVNELPLRQALYWMPEKTNSFLFQDETHWHIHFDSNSSNDTYQFTALFEKQLNDYILREKLDLNLQGLKSAIITKALTGLGD